MKQSIGNIGLNSSFNDAMTYAAIMNPPNQSPGRGKRRGRKPSIYLYLLSSMLFNFPHILHHVNR